MDNGSKMNNTGKMVGILTRLKTEMNGAVVGSMKAKGITYPLSYGVGVPLIREVAASYFPDHELARLLYRQDVRELKLASFSIADPAKVTVGELPFWAAGVTNSELAEHLGTVLLSKTDIVGEVLGQWLVSGDTLLAYSALMAGGGQLRKDKTKPGWDWEKCLDIIGDKSYGLADSGERYLWHGMSVFFMNLIHVVPGSRPVVKRLLDGMAAGNCPGSEYIDGETGWLLE